MKVGHRLAALFPRIDNHTETVPVEPQLAGKLNGTPNHLAPDEGIRHLCRESDVLRRDHQKMRGCLRIDIANHEDILIPVDELHWDLAVRKLWELQT